MLYFRVKTFFLYFFTIFIYIRSRPIISLCVYVLVCFQLFSRKFDTCSMGYISYERRAGLVIEKAINMSQPMIVYFSLYSFEKMQYNSEIFRYICLPSF